EFRLRGPTPAAGGPPTGARDEFVELYNNTNSNIVVTTTDGSFGWTITSSNTAAAPVTATIPNGTIIPARAHYLAANGSGYSLAGFASADTFFSGDIPDDTGLALVRTTTVANYSQPGFLLDAVGFNTDNNPFYREGTGLAPIGSTDGEMSFLRRLTPGTPLDTGVNTNDFILVSTNAANFNGVQSILGAPGPENLASPIQRNAFVKAQLVDPQCGNFGDATTACARVRNGTPVTNGAAGTLAIRRRFTNATGQKITRLRFRIVDLTTLGNLQAGEADLRALSSSDISVTNTASQSVQISGLTLEQSALQPNGGGINSTLSAGSITFSTPLAPGAGVNVEFRLGVQNNGSFRFFVNVEALTTNANVASLAPSKANVVSRKTKELQAEHSTQKR
ncbi:MAG TPA: hypothetical protein VJT82_06110, partial [Pyrinomonadaceae bacterium]|nr:hypothetical protein [Pyrinomonadaceae bacterium]